jgi:HD-GYP domain-containing protein (c-di-GMP phosphodiesterase class II)
LSRLPLHATIVAGLVLLMESLLSFFFASVWHVSWWEYHALMLLGFVTIFYGLILDYRRDTSLTRTISSLLLTGSVAALEQSYSEVLTALVTAVEAKDPYTKGHSEKVARLAVQLGEQLDLPPERLRVLYQAGLLHDIGKIGVPDWILNKPGRLTPSEFAVVRGHPARSEEMIGKIPSLRPTLPGIRWHHERLDGSGYPDGIKGDAVPLDARILAVADVFDAMTSGRSYRPAQPEGAALVYLQHHVGMLFDGRCVQALAVLIEGPSAQTRVQHLTQPIPHQV